MRLDETIATFIYDTLLCNKGVSRVSFTESDILNMCNTINLINGVDYKSSQVGNFMITDYEIPKIFSELIVPVRIRLKAEDAAKNYKAAIYQAGSLNGATLLSPIELNQVWNKILGSIRAKDMTKVDVAPLRTSVLVSAIDTVIYPIKTGLCHYTDAYFNPIAVELSVYEDYMYNVEEVTIFKHWFDNLVVDAKVAK